MTSPSRLLAATLLPLVLTGCALGRPQAFTARSNSFCTDALTGIDKLHPPTTGLQQIRFATDRYTAVEKAVSSLTTMSLPSGATGAALRERWLRPARASLAEGRTQMKALRDAVHDHDATLATTTFASARNVGTSNVDISLLRSEGLDRCATLFTPSR